MDRWLITLACLAALSGLAPPAQSDEAIDQYNLASGFFNMNRFQFAAEEYDKFVKTYPKHAQVPDALFFLGESYFQINRPDPARATFREVVTRYPNSPNYFNALYRLGETSTLAGDTKAAEPALAEFVAKRPGDPLIEHARAYLGSAQLANGKPKEAKRTLERAIENLPEGKLADRCRFDLAQALERVGDAEGALAAYRQLAAKKGSELADDAQLAMGVHAFEAKDYDAAIRSFEELERDFADSPLRATAQLNRALCLYQLLQYDRAAPVFEELARGDSELAAQAWYWRGLTQKAQGAYEDAAATLLAGYQKFSSHALAVDMLFYSADAAFLGGDWTAATDRFLELAGKFRRHRLAEDALYRAAESARAAGRYDQVLALAARLYKEFPQSPRTTAMMLSVGKSLIALERYRDAANALTDLLGRKPDEALAMPAHYYAAVAFHSAGSIDDALTMLAPVRSSPSDDPVVADAQYLAGLCYFEKHEHEKAADALEKYLALRPDGDVAAQALSCLAISLAALGGDDDRLPNVLDRLRDTASDDVLVPALYQVAKTFDKAKEYGRGAELYRQVVAKDAEGPYHARAISGLGWSLYGNKDYAAAAEAFGALVQTHPHDALASEAAYMRGLCLQAGVQAEAAAAAYRAVLSDYGDSAQAFDAGLQLARLLAESEKPAESVAAYEELAGHFGRDERLDRVYYEWARMLVAADEPAKANELLDRLVKQFPSSALIPRALFLSAEARSEQHDFAAVVERLAPLAAKPLPEDLLPGVLYRLGRAHIELAAWSDAKASFERLDREFPEGPLRREAEFWIAEADRQQGDPKAAAVRLARLVAEPGEREPWIATAWLRLAQCQGELKRWKDLLSTTEQLRERFPRYELMNVAEYHSGRALQNLGRFDEAREAYRRAIGGHGDETAAQSQFMIGETYFHQKRYQEALREFLKVEILYAFPRWQADALLEAGKCHENLQENSRAVETYNRILEKYPNTPAAERASERLRLIMK